MKEFNLISTSKQSKTYRSAIIGCGLIAGGYDEPIEEGLVRTHALAYQLNRRTQLVSVMDADAEKAACFAKQWQIGHWFQDAAEMLVKMKPELISICTPDQYHIEFLDLCLQSDFVKAVWCEKPLTTDLAEARRIVEEFENRGKTLLVNYPRGYAPVIRSYKERLLSGELGSVQKVVVYYTKGIRHNGSHALDLLVDWFGYPTFSKVFQANVDFTPDDPTVDALIDLQGTPVYMMGLDEVFYSQFEIDVFCTAARVSFTHNGSKVILQKLQSDSGPGGNHYLSEERSEEDTGSGCAMSSVLEALLGSVDGEGSLPKGEHIVKVMETCKKLACEGRALLEGNIDG